MSPSRLRSAGAPVAAAVFTGVLAGAGTTAVSAATLWSTWGVYGPVSGTTYANRSGSDDSSNYAATGVRTNTGTYVNPYYMGAQARTINNANGQVCAASSWAYNTSVTTAVAIHAPSTACPAGLMYSQGLTKAYTGSGYGTYYAFMSPYFTR